MKRIILVVLVASFTTVSDAAAQQLIIGPTAQAMKQGDFSINLSGLVGGPTIQVGITDRVSIGAGAPLLIPGVNPADHLVVTPKVQLFSSGKTNVAVGAAHVLNRDEPDGGIAYSVVTRSTSNASVTAGVLSGYWSDSSGGTRAAVVGMVGGEKRVTPRTRLIAEGFAGARLALVNVGARATRGHMSVDFSIATAFEEGNPVTVPLFRITWRK